MKNERDKWQAWRTGKERENGEREEARERLQEDNASPNPLSSNHGAGQFLQLGIGFPKGLAVTVFPNTGRGGAELLEYQRTWLIHVAKSHRLISLGCDEPRVGQGWEEVV